jgi:hypothetical protein
MTVEATTSRPVDTEWRGLVRLGAAAAVFVVVMIPLQAAVFILRPPPSTVEGFFALFQEIVWGITLIVLGVQLRKAANTTEASTRPTA